MTCYCDDQDWFGEKYFITFQISKFTCWPQSTWQVYCIWRFDWQWLGPVYFYYRSTFEQHDKENTSGKTKSTEIFTKWIWSLINFDLTNFFNAFIWFMWNTRKNGFRMIWMIIPGALGIQSFSEFSWKPFPQILMAVYLHGSQGSSTLCVTWTQQSHVFTSYTDEI